MAARASIGARREHPVSASDELTVASGASIATRTEQSDGGNIAIAGRGVAHLTDGSITTSVQGGAGDGGNISISGRSTCPARLVDPGQRVRRRRRNIGIDSSYFIASPGSVVEASSRLGVSGTIAVTAPVVDIGAGWGCLPRLLRRHALPARGVRVARRRRGKQLPRRGPGAMPESAWGAYRAAGARRCGRAGEGGGDRGATRGIAVRRDREMNERRVKGLARAAVAVAAAFAPASTRRSSSTARWGAPARSRGRTSPVTPTRPPGGPNLFHSFSQFGLAQGRAPSSPGPAAWAASSTASPAAANPRSTDRCARRFRARTSSSSIPQASPSVRMRRSTWAAPSRDSAHYLRLADGGRFDAASPGSSSSRARPSVRVPGRAGSLIVAGASLSTRAGSALSSSEATCESARGRASPFPPGRSASRASPDRRGRAGVAMPSPACRDLAARSRSPAATYGAAAWTQGRPAPSTSWVATSA